MGSCFGFFWALGRPQFYHITQAPVVWNRRHFEAHLWPKGHRGVIFGFLRGSRSTTFLWYSAGPKYTLDLRDKLRLILGPKGHQVFILVFLRGSRSTTIVPYSAGPNYAVDLRDTLGLIMCPRGHHGAIIGFLRGPKSTRILA